MECSAIKLLGLELVEHPVFSSLPSMFLPLFFCQPLYFLVCLWTYAGHINNMVMMFYCSCGFIVKASNIKSSSWKAETVSGIRKEHILNISEKRKVKCFRVMLSLEPNFISDDCDHVSLDNCLLCKKRYHVVSGATDRWGFIQAERLLHGKRKNLTKLEANFWNRGNTFWQQLMWGDHTECARN